MPPTGQKKPATKQQNKKTAPKKQTVKVPVVPVQEPVVPVQEQVPVPVEQVVVEPIVGGGKQTVRSFSVYYISANGREIADFGGRYIGKAPKQAGRKAFRQIIKYLQTEFEEVITDAIRFSIRETTQGHRMKDKSYHTFHYTGTPNKLAVPKEIERKVPQNYKNPRVGLSMRYGGDSSKNVYPFICQKSKKLVFIHKNDYNIMKDNDAKFRKIAPKNTKIDKEKKLTQQLHEAVALSAGAGIPQPVDEPLVKPKKTTVHTKPKTKAPKKQKVPKTKGVIIGK